LRQIRYEAWKNGRLRDYRAIILKLLLKLEILKTSFDKQIEFGFGKFPKIDVFRKNITKPIKPKLSNVKINSAEAKDKEKPFDKDDKS